MLKKKKTTLCEGEEDTRFWLSKKISPAQTRPHTWRKAWRSHYSQSTYFASVVAQTPAKFANPAQEKMVRDIIGGEEGEFERYQAKCREYMDRGFIGAWAVQIFEECEHCGAQINHTTEDAFLFRSEEEKQRCNLHKYIWRSGELDEGWDWADQFPDYYGVTENQDPRFVHRRVA